MNFLTRRISERVGQLVEQANVDVHPKAVVDQIYLKGGALFKLKFLMKMEDSRNFSTFLPQQW